MAHERRDGWIVEPWRHFFPSEGERPTFVLSLLLLLLLLNAKEQQTLKQKQKKNDVNSFGLVFECGALQSGSTRCNEPQRSEHWISPRGPCLFIHSFIQQQQQQQQKPQQHLIDCFLLFSIINRGHNAERLREEALKAPRSLPGHRPGSCVSSTATAAVVSVSSSRQQLELVRWVYILSLLFSVSVNEVPNLNIEKLFLSKFEMRPNLVVCSLAFLSLVYIIGLSMGNNLNRWASHSFAFGLFA